MFDAVRASPGSSFFTQPRQPVLRPAVDTRTRPGFMPLRTGLRAMFRVLPIPKQRKTALSHFAALFLALPREMHCRAILLTSYAAIAASQCSQRCAKMRVRVRPLAIG